MAKVGLVFIPCYGLSYFVPMLELAKRLLQITQNRFSATVLIANPMAPGTALAQPYIQSLASSDLDIHCEELHPTGLPAHIRGPDNISALYARSHEAVKATIARLHSSTPIAGVFLDFFGTSLIDVADEFGVPSYVFFSTTAVMLALVLHLPTLHEKIPVEFEEMEGMVEVPGIIPIPPLCMPTPLMNKNGGEYSCIIDNGRRLLEAKGIIINTFSELEPAPLKAIRGNQCVPGRTVPPIYPIGPIIAKESFEQNQCVDWLNARPAASVVFLCFGSMGGLDTDMMREMATGLEQSGQRFLWSFRSMDPTVNALELLPEGFLERTKERGLVWPAWVSQKDVLAHPAVGGFVTHCGWNSISESLWFGVPMLGWPLSAEQHLNALEMAREVGAAMELKLERKRGNFVAADEFAKGLKSLMEEAEGKKVRAKVEELKVACRKAVQKGGSSYVSLELLAEDLDNGGNNQRAQ